MRLVLSLLLVLAAGLGPSVTRAADCPSGRLNQIVFQPPCTFGDGTLQVDSFVPSGTPPKGFDGEHNSIFFFTSPPEILGPAVQNSSGDNNCGPNQPHTDPCAPEKASDNKFLPGISKASSIGTVSTVSGLPEIGHVVVTMLDPMVLGAGTLSWSATVNPDGMGAVSSGELDQTTGSFDFPLAQPAQSVTASYEFTLTCTPAPCDPTMNDASIFGIKINITPAPEPSAAAAQATALVLVAALARRRARRLGGTRS